MKTSESLAKFAPAFLKAQRKTGAAVKGSNNPFFKSRYADLGAVMEACKEALNEEGIAVLQPLGWDAVEGDYIETVLLHESGEYISDRTRILAPKNMQDLGSASTYARRFGLQSMVFTPAEDDDGNSVSGKVAAATKAQPAPTKASTPTPPPVEVKPYTTADTPAAEAPKSRTSFRLPPNPKAADASPGLSLKI